MCITFVLPTPAGTFAGRNLDFECHFNERVVLTPRDYQFTFRNGQKISSHEALLGMATVMDDYPLYAEATNESGLYMAGLYFPGYAHWTARRSERGISPYELIPFTLTQATSAAQARDLLSDAHLTDEAFAPDLPLSPLHFFIADPSGQAFVLEQTGDTVEIFDNPAQVLTNNPTFPFHLENLRYYLGISPDQPSNTLGGSELELTANGRGFGQLGLPGDPTPVSRFIRGAYQVRHASRPHDAAGAATQVMHILDHVKLIHGSTHTEDGSPDFTMYSAALDLTQFEYYYTTYENRRITRVAPSEHARSGDTLVQHELLKDPDFSSVAL